MRRVTIAICCGLLALAAVAPAHNLPVPAGLEVLLETGMALPLGDLGSSFTNTETGMGAEKGYRMGVRMRWTVESGLYVAPTFTFSEFGDYDGYNDTTGKTASDGGKFKVRGSVVRMGVDFGYLAPGRRDEVRLLMGAGLSVNQNRYKETIGDDDYFYEDSIYAFGWMMTVGMRWRDLEVAVEYHGNQFRTARFFQTDGYYNWNHAAVRLGYALPRF